MSLQLAIAVVCAFVIGAVPARAVAQEEPNRRITQVRGQLYQLQDGEQCTVFLVTPDGIALGDPLSRPTASWFKDQLAAQFPGVTVRYLLLSHHALERVAGGGVFSDKAELVGHREFNARLSAARRLSPDSVRFVPDVRSIYDSRRTITLGQSTIDLIHVGSLQFPDLTALYFPGERIVFSVDPPPVKTVPFSFGAARPRDVFTWLRALAPLDFDTILFGNGQVLSRTDFDALAQYLEALRGLVITSYERGQTLSELEPGSKLDARNPHYPERAKQFERVFDAMTEIRGEMSVALLTTFSRRNPSDYCASYPFCSAGGAVPAGAAAATLLLGRTLGVVTEATLNQQAWISRAASKYAEEAAIRQSRVAVLVKWSRPRAGILSYALLGGVSRTFGSVRGMNQVIGVQLPIGGRHDITGDESSAGLTGGVDVLIRAGEKLRLVAPIRVTRIMESLPANWPSAVDVQVGLGIGVRVFRRVD